MKNFSIRNQGPLKSSLNAGELSPDLHAKVGLKQYYSGARRMINLEPVPQSGFRLAPGTTFIDTVISENCRLFCLRTTSFIHYILVLTENKIRIYRANNGELVKVFTTPRITADRLDEYEFYGEANTVGIFHEDDDFGIKLFRNPDDQTDWTLTNWPYESVPKVDLGGTYTKTPDIWYIYLRYIETTARLTVSLTVDGEDSEAVVFVDAGTLEPKAPSTAGGATTADYNMFAANIAAALNALPSITSGVTCVYLPGETAPFYRVLKVTFDGDSAGVEYEFDCLVVNTSDASTLVAHTQTGETALEALISPTRGGFAGMMLYQDRAVYFGAKAERASIGMSKTGEYFDLDITKQGDNAARLERLRTETSQRILAVTEDAYLLVFTDQGEWFINNRVIKQTEPLNFVLASEIGTRKGVQPQKFDGRTIFISKDGSSLHSIKYDAVSESFVPTQEDLLATHLISGIRRQCVQRKIAGSTTPRVWELRDDGRLVMGVSIRDQEITAFCEWKAANDGFICDICLDGSDRLWMVIKRGGTLTLEIMNEADDNLFQCAIDTTTDLTGIVTGLGILEGDQVWARIDGYVDGPYTVVSGRITTGHFGKAAKVGLWQPPYFESMPYFRLLPNEEVLQRPARVHTVTASLIDTESVAISANGRTPRNVPLTRAGDDLTAAPLPFTGAIEVAGLMGVADGPTVVITQTRPGKLRLRDYMPGIKF